MSDGEEIVLELDGKTYNISPRIAASIEEVLTEHNVVVEEINGIDAPIVKLLEELTEVNWKQLITNDHTTTLIALGLFVDYYDYYEGANELANYTVEHFQEGDLHIGQKASRVLEIIRNGNF